VTLLGIGILFNSQRARLASAVVIALTILKAFLIDMSTLTGVYRALSFMCLGLVLGGDRLAVSADPVPQAGIAAGLIRCSPCAGSVDLARRGKHAAPREQLAERSRRPLRKSASATLNG